MRWQSRLAIGALLLLPTLGASGAARAGVAITTAPRTPDEVQRSVTANGSTEPAVITTESDARRSAPSLRPALGALPTNTTLTLAAWLLVGAIAALVASVCLRPARRGRAPPLRFL